MRDVPFVLMILRLLTSVGSVVRLFNSLRRWITGRGKKVGPTLRPRFDWQLEGTPPQLRFRIKNNGKRSAIIDELRFTVEGRDGARDSIPLPATFDEMYPVQVKPDESSHWHEIEVPSDVVELLRERER